MKPENFNIALEILITAAYQYGTWTYDIGSEARAAREKHRRQQDKAEKELVAAFEQMRQERDSARATLAAQSAMVDEIGQMRHLINKLCSDVSKLHSRLDAMLTEGERQRAALYENSS